MNKYVVNSFEEYVNIITKIGNENNSKWFRGQSKCEYRLTPSAFRKMYAIEDWKGIKIDSPFEDNPCSGSNNKVAILPIDIMVKKFREKTNSLLEYDVDNKIEWECIAQHYGIPTRLLDWSTNALVALYFAVEDCKIESTNEYDIDEFMEFGFSGGGGAVFVIDPLEINKMCVPNEEFADNPIIFNTSEYGEFLETLLDEAFPPICFYGFNKEKRIARQAGNFTLFGKLMWPMDYYQVIQEKITKIFIPYEAYDEIREMLGALGYTQKTIYVEKDKKELLAEKIAKKTYNEFISEFS